MYLVTMTPVKSELEQIRVAVVSYTQASLPSETAIHHLKPHSPEPKYHPVPYIGDYSWRRPIGLWSIVVHYVGNRVLFGTWTTFPTAMYYVCARPRRRQHLPLCIMGIIVNSWSARPPAFTNILSVSSKTQHGPQSPAQLVTNSCFIDHF